MKFTAKKRAKVSGSRKSGQASSSSSSSAESSATKVVKDGKTESAKDKGRSGKAGERIRSHVLSCYSCILRPMRFHQISMQPSLLPSLSNERKVINLSCYGKHVISRIHSMNDNRLFISFK